MRIQMRRSVSFGRNYLTSNYAHQPERLRNFAYLVKTTTRRYLSQDNFLAELRRLLDFFFQNVRKRKPVNKSQAKIKLTKIRTAEVFLLFTGNCYLVSTYVTN